MIPAEQSTQRAALKALTTTGEPLSSAQIATKVTEATGIAVSSNDISKRIANLIQEGHVQRHHNPTGVLTYSATPSGSERATKGPGFNVSAAIIAVLDEATAPLTAEQVTQVIGCDVSIRGISGLLHSLKLRQKVQSVRVGVITVWGRLDAQFMPSPTAKLTPPAPNAVEPKRAPTGPAPVVSESPPPPPSPGAAATPCAAHEAASETSGHLYEQLFDTVMSMSQRMGCPRFSGEMTDVPRNR